jgi:RNA-directed DNA polymerase
LSLLPWSELASPVEAISWAPVRSKISFAFLVHSELSEWTESRIPPSLAELIERMRKFSLELHPEKTRLLEFGPFATENRKKRGEGKPETFNFLGFTHICGKKRGNGRFTVLRQTIRKRLQAKLSEVKAELKRRMHDPIPEVGQWLRSVVGGHIRYYGVPTNRAALYTFRFQVGRLWHRTLLRRSQKARVLWDRMRRLIDRWLPPARTCHPYPLRRMGVIT